MKKKTNKKVAKTNKQEPFKLTVDPPITHDDQCHVWRSNYDAWQLQRKFTAKHKIINHTLLGPIPDEEQKRQEERRKTLQTVELFPPPYHQILPDGWHFALADGKKEEVVMVHTDEVEWPPIEI